ncbi:MAG: hypothetical protein LBJ03_01785 [Holosporales bacterium]|nr:hypothetical protein [Holosporales bacterium]
MFYKELVATDPGVQVIFDTVRDGFLTRSIDGSNPSVLNLFGYLSAYGDLAEEVQSAVEGKKATKTTIMVHILSHIIAHGDCCRYGPLGRFGDIGILVQSGRLSAFEKAPSGEITEREMPALVVLKPVRAGIYRLATFFSMCDDDPSTRFCGGAGSLMDFRTVDFGPGAFCFEADEGLLLSMNPAAAGGSALLTDEQINEADLRLFEEEREAVSARIASMHFLDTSEQTANHASSCLEYFLGNCAHSALSPMDVHIALLFAVNAPQYTMSVMKCIAYLKARNKLPNVAIYAEDRDIRSRGGHSYTPPLQATICYRNADAFRALVDIFEPPIDRITNQLGDDMVSLLSMAIIANPSGTDPNGILEQIVEKYGTRIVNATQFGHQAVNPALVTALNTSPHYLRYLLALPDAIVPRITAGGVRVCFAQWGITSALFSVREGSGLNEALDKLVILLESGKVAFSAEDYFKIMVELIPNCGDQYKLTLMETMLLQRGDDLEKSFMGYNFEMLGAVAKTVMSVRRTIGLEHSLTLVDIMQRAIPYALQTEENTARHALKFKKRDIPPKLSDELNGHKSRLTSSLTFAETAIKKELAERQ